MPKTTVIQIEEYIKEIMKDVAYHHSYSHVSRVRNRAVKIAREEGFEDLELVEIAALMHDVGLAYSEDRTIHGEKGAEIAGKYLRENNLLPEEKVGQITLAIEHHSGRNIGGNQLLDILQDADCLEALGAIGILRACTSKADWPEYNPDNIKGLMWGKCGEKYRGVFFPKPEEKTIIDEINMQIHYYDNLVTDTARQLAEPLVRYMKDFILELEKEVMDGWR